jgi:hypothetical protein
MDTEHEVVEVSSGRDIPAALAVETDMPLATALLLRFGGIAVGVEKELPTVSLRPPRNELGSSRSEPTIKQSGKTYALRTDIVVARNIFRGAAAR